MAIQKLNINEFLLLRRSVPVIDVRSPGEYEHAHIPGAVSLPLFTNAERANIGTTYKQKSRQEAIKMGLDSFGKNLVEMVEAVEKIVAQNSNKEIVVHCWRGGMRSAAVAWLLDLYGFKVNVLVGGYKSYRRWALEQFTKNYSLNILGGYTGSNKTTILQQLKQTCENVIDLEALAGHKGSAFGNLELKPQPSQEQFENELALQLCTRSSTKNNLWLEGESQRIGNINIPLAFYKTMRTEPLIFLEIPFEERLSHIVNEYGKHEKEKIVNAIIRIKKRLGGLETKNAINFLLENDVKNCFAILLKYYDKVYLKSTYTNEFKDRKITHVNSDTIDAKLNLKKILNHVEAGN